MRKALITLSGVGLLVAFQFTACVVKDTGNDGGGGSDSNGGSTSKSSSSTGKGGASVASTTAASTGKGGASTSTSSTAKATGGTSSSSTYIPPATGGGGGITASTCPDLLAQLKQSPDQVCSSSKSEASFTKMNMLIVLDKSGSMNAIPEGYKATKWAGAVDALQRSLDPNDALMSYGLLLYPYDAPVAATTCELRQGDDAVNVKVGLASDTVKQINDVMKATAPGGGTPTAKALSAAYDYYTKGAGIGLEGTKYVLLVTDGGPNCNPAITCSTDACTAFMDKSPALASCWNGGVANCCDKAAGVTGGLDPQSLCLDDAAVTAQLDALRAANIPTFVIGIPGSEAYAAYLDSFAVHGGEPVKDKAHQYYEVTGETGLAEAFKSITTSLVGSCEVPLTEAPKDRNAINVAIDCSPLPQMTGAVENWKYDEAGVKIVIEGAKCDAIKASGVKRIDVVNGCPIFKIE